MRTRTGSDCHQALSARLPAIRASQMVHSVIMAAIRGSLVLISTPTEHNVHNNVCSISGCTMPAASKQTPLLQGFTHHVKCYRLNCHDWYWHHISKMMSSEFKFRMLQKKVLLNISIFKKIFTVTGASRLWALLYVSSTGAVQVPLLVSNQHSSHFHTQRPRCVGLKMRCGQTIAGALWSSG